MARGRKTGGRNFVPGNPIKGGRPKLDPEVKAIRRLDRDTLNRYINDAMEMTSEEAEKLLACPKTPRIKRIIANVMKNADLLGDVTRLRALLDYVVGPIKVEQPTAQVTLNFTADRPRLSEIASRIIELQKQRDGSHAHSG